MIRQKQVVPASHPVGRLPVSGNLNTGADHPPPPPPPPPDIYAAEKEYMNIFKLVPGTAAAARHSVLSTSQVCWEGPKRRGG